MFLGGQKMKLPVGVQDFYKLRRENYTYIDKTKYIYELKESGDVYFLSRPRRFGKSLLITTMEAYFSGQKELFEGLYIYDKETQWLEYPVIKISFARDNFEQEGHLEICLNEILTPYEKKYDVKVDENTTFAIRLERIIKSAYEKTSLQVVVLVDEYDKPILDAMYTNLESHNHSVLRGFYSPLKELDHYLHFIFLTGITKISHVNIFSGLNQLEDISMMKKYACICGITEEEIKNNFDECIKTFAEEKEITYEETLLQLKQNYDGYHFSKKSVGVYNPFSLIRALKELDLGSYWFESGTPTILIKTMKNTPEDFLNFVDGVNLNQDDFKVFNPETNAIIPLVYQSGYLTIKGYEDETDTYFLRFPNKEVEEGFLKCLIPSYIKMIDSGIGLTIEKIRQSLREENIEKLMLLMKSIVSDVPTALQKSMIENYYQTIVHVMLRLTGFVMASELQGINGRADIVLQTRKSVFIFELKAIDDSKIKNESDEDYEKRISNLKENALNDALNQIEQKGYPTRFASAEKSMFKVGVVFSKEGNGLLGWKN